MAFFKAHQNYKRKIPSTYLLTETLTTGLVSCWHCNVVAGYLNTTAKRISPGTDGALILIHWDLFHILIMWLFMCGALEIVENFQSTARYLRVTRVFLLSLIDVSFWRQRQEARVDL